MDVTHGQQAQAAQTSLATIEPMPAAAMQAADAENTPEGATSSSKRAGPMREPLSEILAPSSQAAQTPAQHQATRKTSPRPTLQSKRGPPHPLKLCSCRSQLQLLPHSCTQGSLIVESSDSIPWRSCSFAGLLDVLGSADWFLACAAQEKHKHPFADSEIGWWGYSV